jgi:hypothetical protein
MRSCVLMEFVVQSMSSHNPFSEVKELTVNLRKKRLFFTIFGENKMTTHELMTPSTSTQRSITKESVVIPVGTVFSVSLSK